MAAPKLFISYCWSNQEHEQMVLDLATELRQSGVDVILDKWDLKEGQDAIVFMEQMVTNEEIKKVAIICNEEYALRADNRKGGVGTETQIISQEVYNRENQNKFVAIVTERDGSGKPHLPTYYKSRIYIDFCDNSKYSENFERLLRWIFDKPYYPKPELGSVPSYISEENPLSFGTEALNKRCIDAITNNKSNAIGILEDYFEKITENFSRLKINKSEGEIDDLVISSIDSFIPIRNEIVRIISTIARYNPREDFIDKIHRFLERIIPYIYGPENYFGQNSIFYDNFKFIIHELFLYISAVLIKNEKFELANILLQKPYYINRFDGNNYLTDYSIFYQRIQSFDIRNARLNMNRLSIQADLLNQRSLGSGIDFYYLLQADFVIYFRSELNVEADQRIWRPITSIYLENYNHNFEVFARAISKKYFEKIKIILSINSLQEIKTLLEKYENGSRKLPRFNYHELNPSAMLGFPNLCKLP